VRKAIAIMTTRAMVTPIAIIMVARTSGGRGAKCDHADGDNGDGDCSDKEGEGEERRRRKDLEEKEIEKKKKKEGLY